MPAHKREIDEEEVAKYALVGCYDKTIARLTGIPETTLKRRCGDLISKKRAERKYNIRAAQEKAIEQGVPSMLIFLGKNELNQTDRQEQIHGITDGLASLMKEIGGNGVGLPIKEK